MIHRAFSQRVLWDNVIATDKSLLWREGGIKKVWGGDPQFNYPRKAGKPKADPSAKWLGRRKEKGKVVILLSIPHSSPI